MRRKGKVLFIDTVHPVLQESLEALGYECLDLTNKSPRQIDNYLTDCKGFVIRSRFKITREIMDASPELKFIARSGSGLENIDVEHAKRKNIHCFNSPEGNKDALGEHCIAMLLNMFNNINQAHQQVQNGIWQREINRGIELKGKTIGLIGFGLMGQSFAEKLAGFGVKVIAYDNGKTNFSSALAEEVTEQELFDQSDIVSLHVNYLPDNYHLVNTSFIESFKKNIYLLNTARGKCVNTHDLIAALKSGKVLGAGLDVLEIESDDFELTPQSKRQLKQLTSFKQVLVTPHVGGWTNESYYKLSKVLMEKISEII
jgi:D-3-phosphoglycerate dehydrogenase